MAKNWLRNTALHHQHDGSVIFAGAFANGKTPQGKEFFLAAEQLYGRVLAAKMIIDDEPAQTIECSAIPCIFVKAKGERFDFPNVPSATDLKAKALVAWVEGLHRAGSIKLPGMQHDEL